MVNSPKKPLRIWSQSSVIPLATSINKTPQAIGCEPRLISEVLRPAEWDLMFLKVFFDG